MLKTPVLIEVSKANSTSHKVEQTVHHVDKERKKELLIHLLNKNSWKQVLVFTRTKHGANKLSEALIKDKITSAAIHGNKSQGARTKALDDFKAGTVRVLVATDIAARGIDIDQLPHVINFELPNVPEDYVHRIGRTGRAGNSGDAISLVCIDEHDYLLAIEKLIKQKINKIAIEGFKVNQNLFQMVEIEQKVVQIEQHKVELLKQKIKLLAQKELLVRKEMKKNHIRVKNQEEIAIDLAQKEVKLHLVAQEVEE